MADNTNISIKEPSSTRRLFTRTQVVRSVKTQFTHTQRALLILVAVISGLFTGIYALSIMAQISVDTFTRDVAATANLPGYTGFISNLGLVIWGATAILCLFGYHTIAGSTHKHRFLLSSAILSAILGLDDMVLLHENILPDLLPQGEKIIYFLYGLMVISYVWNFIDEVLKTDYFLFFGALGFLSASLVIDIVLPFSSLITFLEDAFKFAGIALWMTYFFQTLQVWLKQPETIPAS